jgi:hypothetical protein
MLLHLTCASSDAASYAVSCARPFVICTVLGEDVFSALRLMDQSAGVPVIQSPYMILLKL